jgi:signal transduction histidine kinase
LLANADKYSPPATPVEIEACLDDGQLRITITDHGSGIPKEMQSKIFERFQRLERGDRISSQGWGLGLYFAKALTEAQGGYLTVRSPVRQQKTNPGAAFTLTIPIADEVPEDV